MYKRLDGKMCDWEWKMTIQQQLCTYMIFWVQEAHLLGAFNPPKYQSNHRTSRRFRFSTNEQKPNTWNSCVCIAHSNEYKEVCSECMACLHPLTQTTNLTFIFVSNRAQSRNGKWLRTHFLQSVANSMFSRTIVVFPPNYIMKRFQIKKKIGEYIPILKIFRIDP